MRSISFFLKELIIACLILKLMIFLSAQPDDYYFLWQLQLQLYNFSRMGINSDKIHVLIGFDKDKGLAHYFRDFITQNNDALFYMYPDTRTDSKYPSSLRPHIIAKHYKAQGYLENESIFYHDSDIIFNKLPDFNRLLRDEVWYASNTNYYTDSNYIKNTAGEDVFNRMCDIIGLEREKVECNDLNSGGAQYLLKKASYFFWEKLEIDCEKIYDLLTKHNLAETLHHSSGKRKIQAWCADMWCIWWQAIALGKSVAVDAELDFSWAHTRLENTIENNIIHYTGNVPIENHVLFRKNNYFNCSPFYDDFTLIDVNSSSYNVIKEIEGYNNKRHEDFPVLNDVTFFIRILSDSEEDLEMGLIALKYLYYNVSTNLVVLESGKLASFKDRFYRKDITYFLIGDEAELRKALKGVRTKYGVLYPANFIFSIPQMVDALEGLKESDVVIYNKDGFLGVDLLLRVMFSKLLDISLFDLNRGKMSKPQFEITNECLFFRNELEIIQSIAHAYSVASDLRLILKSKIPEYNLKQIDGTVYYMIGH